MRWLVISLLLCASHVGAQTRSDIVILGEAHDNPTHHAAQARIVAELAPRAVVFEMLTEEQAARIPKQRLDEQSLEELLEWASTGWPDFSLYYPIFEAAEGAAIYGAAVPRDVARAAMASGADEAFGEDAERFGLLDPLPEQEQSDREQLQREAHCGALPEEMLPVMVSIQRLRDAVLARSALRALEETGGQVVVITGNGHARADWGVPAVISRAAPDILVTTFGQSEDGQVPPGRFDRVFDAPAPEREDPCLAFR
ncbi:Uncharacterized iron-regulated protein [Poseidonocella pacifica]|uniref:Uncharacterized iron-regulated protein n=1 Tax=Poseidonocella pacifica TaxID=871651 RepID=A0A1I0YYF2_9RHOB|nr:ChaN family lipoprotein [Poseidonocella pacifica]SFB18384.1 Uncharacterized iron-regulated protein [Poseidonocella pacifica]